ncbi:NTP transferase domain-containing protein [bacterium]|nr:NTP transferase domain-containing protein [bacterium]
MLTTDDLEFVILAAGKSTRNYPHSKGIPHKSLIPFGSRKVIDYIIKELISSGAKHITIVCSDEKAKESFELCFTKEQKIEDKFKKNGNIIGLELLQSLYIPDDVEIKYVIQDKPKGLGHAIGLANKIANGRHLVVRVPDDIVLPNHAVKDAELRKSVVRRCIEKYIADGIGGNMFITRHVKDPSRWGIIDDGIFKEKPKESKSDEAFHTLAIFDKKVAKRLEEIANLIDTVGTEEYNLWETEGKEIHFDKYLNEEVKKDSKNMAIRTFPISKTDTYLDCGTLQGYEEALLYTLLKESVFKEKNKQTAQILLIDCMLEDDEE